MDNGDGHNVMEVDPQPGTSHGRKRRLEEDGEDKYRTPKKTRGEYSDSDVSTPESRGLSHASGSDMDSAAGGYSPVTDMDFITELCEKFIIHVDKVLENKEIENKAGTTENVGIQVGPGLQPVAGGSMEGQSSTEGQGETVECLQNVVLHKNEDVDDADDEADGDDVV